MKISELNKLVDTYDVWANPGIPDRRVDLLRDYIQLVQSTLPGSILRGFTTFSEKDFFAFAYECDPDIGREFNRDFLAEDSPTSILFQYILDNNVNVKEFTTKLQAIEKANKKNVNSSHPSTNDSQSYLANLPKDIVLEIVSHLDDSATYSLSYTSKFFNQTISNRLSETMHFKNKLIEMGVNIKIANELNQFLSHSDWKHLYNRIARLSNLVKFNRSFIASLDSNDLIFLTGNDRLIDSKCKDHIGLAKKILDDKEISNYLYSIRNESYRLLFNSILSNTSDSWDKNFVQVYSKKKITGKEYADWLKVAAFFGSNKIIYHLLSKIKHLPLEAYNTEMTLLNYACLSGNLSTVKMIVSLLREENIKPYEERSAKYNSMFYAILSGNLELVHYLKNNFSMRMDSYPHLAIANAFISNNVKMVDWVISELRIKNITPKIKGKTLFRRAAEVVCSQGNLVLAHKLFEHGLIVSDSQENLLKFALQYNHYQLADYLIEQLSKLNFDFKSVYLSFIGGYLDLAVKEKNVQMARYLVTNLGLDPNAIDLKSATISPLKRAETFEEPLRSEMINALTGLEPANKLKSSK